MEVKAYVWNNGGLQTLDVPLPTGTFGVVVRDKVEGHDIEIVYDDDLPTVELTLDGVSVKDFDGVWEKAEA